MKPDKTKMYGLLHDVSTGAAISRQVRILKVGIGVPVGKDIHVWVEAGDPDDVWCVETNNASKTTKKIERFKGEDARDKAFVYYVKMRKEVGARTFPRKLSYFTYLRMAGDGTFAHDFDAIDEHGPQPTECDILFVKNDPLDAAFQWWTAAELKCEGDGINARRRNSLAKGERELELVQISSAANEKFFPIDEGCYAKGCLYPRGEQPVCKPHARLNFQLVNSPRFGGTCTFDTTGFRSTSQLFSCIQEIKTITGRGNPEQGTVTGIPLKFVLRPYRTSHGGKPATQYGVSLEFRASNPVELARLLHEHAANYQEALKHGEPLQLTAGADATGEVIEDGAPGQPTVDEESATLEASALHSEFYGEFSGHPDEGDGEPPDDEPPIQKPQRKSESAKAKAAAGTDKKERKPRTRKASAKDAPAADDTEASETQAVDEPAQSDATATISDPGPFTGECKAKQRVFEPTVQQQVDLRALGREAGQTEINRISQERYGGTPYDELSPEAFANFVQWLEWKKATRK